MIVTSSLKLIINTTFTTLISTLISLTTLLLDYFLISKIVKQYCQAPAVLLFPADRLLYKLLERKGFVLLLKLYDRLI